MKLMSILLILISSSLFANELAWVDEQVNAIKPNRLGAKNSNITKIRNPFIYLKKNIPKNSKSTESKNSVPINKPTLSKSNTVASTSYENANLNKVVTPNSILTLSAIINSSALINGDWYRLGEKVNNYKIIKITKTSVTLTKKKKTTVLSTKSSIKKLKFK